jgi:hypothetical protein
MADTDEPSKKNHDLGLLMKAAMDDLSQNVDGLRTSYPLASKSILDSDTACFDRFKEFLLSNGLGSVPEDSPESIVVRSIPHEHYYEFRRLERALDKTRRGHTSLSRSFLVSLVSVFDFFMAFVIRFLLLRIPALLNDKESMSFEQLSKFDSIDSAKLFVINREIDSLLRQSRSEQFKWLETKLRKIDLRLDKDLWAVVVELEQRRNMFVHCDGRVTEAYRVQCERHGVPLPKGMKDGDILLNSEEYFDQCCRAILEIGIRVSQQVWRQLLPNDDKADTEFLMFCYYRISDGEHGIATRLLRAAQDQLQFKYHSQDTEYKNLLNLAQAYKWSGDEKLCEETLKSRDFSATSAVLRLAKACLEENWQEAIRLVKEIGPNCPDMLASYYRDWPIFRGLREDADFPQVFEQVFGEPLFIAKVIKSEPDDAEGRAPKD